MEKNWESLGLCEELSEILIRLGFKKPTPIQKASIPLFTRNKDICVESYTGSGKTLCFLLPLFQKMLSTEPLKGLFSIILAPSRELAKQIKKVADSLNSLLSNSYQITMLIGGYSRESDYIKLESEANILIATPGRLEDLLENTELINTKSLEVLILDEADDLLNLGFQKEIHFILEKLPKERRTGLFSATMTTEVRELVNAGLRNPAFITVNVQPTVKSDTLVSAASLPSGLENFYIILDTYEEKLPSLLWVLKEHLQQKIIVFFGTCASVNFYHQFLSESSELSGTLIYKLHGKMKQSQRERIYQEFEKMPEGILVATDLLARGIDFPDIEWIIEFDAPQDPDVFVHRIGRTARAGRTGKTLLYLIGHEKRFVEFLELKKIRMIKIETGSIECLEKLRFDVVEYREYYEKAQECFVAYVRFYKENELQFIFQMKNLDLGCLAHSLGLIRIPRIKEILGKAINFEEPDLDPDEIAFRDPFREKKREEALIEKKNRGEKKKKKKEGEKRVRTKSEKRKAKWESLVKEWKEEGKEERIIKKIKKGKLNDSEVQEYLESNPKGSKIFRKKNKRKSNT